MESSARARRRRLPLTAAILVVVAVASVGGWQLFCNHRSNLKMSEQSAQITSLVDKAGGVDSFELQYQATDAERTLAGYHLVIDAADSYSAEEFGGLLTQVFTAELDVAVVSIEFDSDSSLQVVHADRDRSQWAELISASDDLEATTVRVAQFGPEGIAEFRADVSSTSGDVMHAYEQVSTHPLPDWVSLGNLELETVEGMWPRLAIHAQRPITSSEWDEFRSRANELRSQLQPGEQFSLCLRVAAASQQAVFEEAVVPAPAPQFDPKQVGVAP